MKITVASQQVELDDVRQARLALLVDADGNYQLINDRAHEPGELVELFLRIAHELTVKEFGAYGDEPPLLAGCTVAGKLTEYDWDANPDGLPVTLNSDGSWSLRSTDGHAG